jgi:hypothetical protein
MRKKNGRSPVSTASMNGRTCWPLPTSSKSNGQNRSIHRWPFKRHAQGCAFAAFGIVRDLEALRDSDGLTGDQHEILAEAYAETGRYDLAAETTQKADSREVYTRYWDAMNLPDDDWCPHHEKHKYVKEIVYSFKHGQEMPMLACNVCDIWNVADMPEVLEAARKRRAEVRHATKGMSIEQVKTFLQSNFRPR